MSRSVDSLRIAKFRLDRSLLLYKDIDIAKRMRMDKSNYSSYINGRKTITIAFLRKFYNEFGDEIDKLKKGESPDTGARRDAVALNEFMAEFKVRSNFILDRCDVLLNKYEQIVNRYPEVSSEISQLEQKVETVLLQRIVAIENLVKGKIDKSNGSH